MPPILLRLTSRQLSSVRKFTSSSQYFVDDPRLGRLIHDEFGTLRSKYSSSLSQAIIFANSFSDAPKHAIVLAHGLFGFAELRLAGKLLPAVHYWRGIREALQANGVEVIVAHVSPSGSIEARAEKLAETIRIEAKGKKVNIVAHSMVSFDLSFSIRN
jgi:triacylglycerol lipase